MTCIDLSVEDLLRCSFGLGRREVSVLMKLLDDGGWLAVSAIAPLSGRDRSVVQRALTLLIERGLAERSQRNRERGGYEYLYRAKDKAAIKRTILEKSRAFCRLVAEEVRGW